MRVLIIEDEAPAFRRLQKTLEEIDPSIQILEVIDSVQDSVMWLRNHEQPDLVFMDIQLADGLSFDIFDEVEITSPIIFTTAFDEYAIRAFKVNSIDYILKPIDKSLLEQSLKKLSALRAKSDVNISELLRSLNSKPKNYKPRFLVKFHEELLSIDVNDVSGFYTEHGNVYLITNQSKKHSIDYTLDYLEKELDPLYFFRLNRQHIAHVNSIESASVYENGKVFVALKYLNESSIIVSREKSGTFKKWFGA